MRTITGIDANQLAIGLQRILLDMKMSGTDLPSISIDKFENTIQEEHGVSKRDAEEVTVSIINTGILRWEIFANNFIL